jgi:hypothetical protein
LNAGVPIQRSSCITCHGYASFDKDGKAYPLPDPLQSDIGNIDPSKMKAHVSNDFIWGVITNVKP